MFTSEECGLYYQCQKSTTSPSPEIKFLGMVVNLVTMEMKLPREKRKLDRKLTVCYLQNNYQPNCYVPAPRKAKYNYPNPKNGSPILPNLSEASFIRQPAKLSGYGLAFSSGTGNPTSPLGMELA